LAAAAVLLLAAGVAAFPAGLETAALAVISTAGFAAAFGVVFVVDGLAAMSVATPVAVFAATEPRCGQQYKLFADEP